MKVRTCRWIVRPASPGVEAVYCDCSVGHYYLVGDDGSKRRVYETFCPKHKALAEKEEFDERDPR